MLVAEFNGAEVWALKTLHPKPATTASTHEANIKFPRPQTRNAPVK